MKYGQLHKVLYTQDYLSKGESHGASARLDIIFSNIPADHTALLRKTDMCLNCKWFAVGMTPSALSNSPRKQ